MHRNISKHENEIKKLRTVSGGDIDISDVIRDVLGFTPVLGLAKESWRCQTEVISNCFILVGRYFIFAKWEDSLRMNFVRWDGFWTWYGVPGLSSTSVYA